MKVGSIGMSSVGYIATIRFLTLGKTDREECLSRTIVDSSRRRDGTQEKRFGKVLPHFSLKDHRGVEYCSGHGCTHPYDLVN